MPYKRYRKNYKRKNPRRKIYRRRPGKRLRNIVPNGASPLARNYLVRLKYSDTIDFSPVSLATVYQVFNMNSIFDPDATNIGHQPYGRDQLVALFNRYRVYKFSWRISIAPSNDRLHACVIPNNGNVNTGTTFVALCEQPRAVSKVLAFDGGMPCVFKGHTYLPKIAGVTSVQYKTDDRYSAAMTGTPAEGIQLALALYNPSSVTVNTSITFTLVYHTELFDPLVLGQS